MKNAFAPIGMPSSADCRDALKKGLGRCWFWAANGQLDLAELQAACVTDLRYDQQCEDDRCDWLWSLMQAGSLTTACEEVVWDAVKILRQQQGVPDWMLEETRFDCNPITRQVFYPQLESISMLVYNRMRVLRIGP